MNSLRRALPWLVVLVIAALIWFIPTDRKASSGNDAASREPHGFRRGGGGGGGANSDRSAAGNIAVVPDPQITRLMEHSREAFMASKGADESSVILAELREAVRSAANEQATAAAIRAFLQTGKDAPTKLPFVVGPDGTLESAPSLRSALLDLLGSLDPETSLTISREIMDRKSSPDEYAVALRNLAWNDLDGDLMEKLSRRFTSMLETGDWLAQPSAGFLEALDAAVQVSNGAAFNALMQANRVAAPEFSRAAFIAVDRMVQRKPALIVDAFQADPALTGLTRDQRASLLSRLDITDPAQRDVFSRYLTASDHGPRELEYFTGLFPNGNQLHGNWLITGDETPRSIDEQRRMDNRTLDEIRRMVDGNATGPAHDAMIRIRERLIKVVGDSPGESKK